MNADGHIYFTEGKVPLEDKERLQQAMTDDREAIEERLREMKAQMEQLERGK